MAVAFSYLAIYQRFPLPGPLPFHSTYLIVYRPVFCGKLVYLNIQQQNTMWKNVLKRC